MKIHKIIFFLITSFIISCSNSGIEEKPLAKVFDIYLHAKDLDGIVTEGMSKEDSTVATQHKVDLWVKKQLMLNKAEMYLTPEQKDVEKEVEDYRASLLIYRYKQEFIKQKLDTIVENSDINSYYKTYQQSFLLSTSAIRAVFVSFPKTSPNLNKLKELFFSKKFDKNKINDFCRSDSGKYEDFDEKWVLFFELSNLLPIKISDPESFLSTTSEIQTQDENTIYLVKILEKRLKGEAQPIEFVSDQIRSLILNKRKVDLTDELEQNIYTNAIEQNNITIYK